MIILRNSSVNVNPLAGSFQKLTNGFTFTEVKLTYQTMNSYSLQQRNIFLLVTILRCFSEKKSRVSEEIVVILLMALSSE